MPKKNEFPNNIQSPFSPELDSVMRDEQKFDDSPAQAMNKSGKDSNPSVTMDGGVPTDSKVDSDFPK